MQSGQMDNGQYASDGNSSGSPTGTGIREFGYPYNPQSGNQGSHQLHAIDKYFSGTYNDPNSKIMVLLKTYMLSATLLNINLLHTTLQL